MSDYADLLGVQHSKKSALDQILQTPPKSTAKTLKEGTPFKSPTTATRISETPLRSTQKRKIVQTTDKWRWKPFINNARDDGAVFYHWVRVDDDDDDEPVELNYPFEVLNKKARVFQYSDDDYKNIIEPMDEKSDWTREETDLLFSLCKTFDLRFIVVHDRFCSSELKSKESAIKRSVEDLKKRYYDISRAILKQRAKGIPKEKLMTHPILSVDYDYDYEVRRKQNLEALFSRSSEVEKKENELREQLKKIEQIKKKREEEEQQKIKQKQKEEKEKLRREAQLNEKLRKDQEEMRLASTPAVFTVDEEIMAPIDESISKFDSFIVGELKRGKAYNRSFLISDYDDYEYHYAVAETLGVGIASLMPTRKVHEAFEGLKPLFDKYMSLYGRPVLPEYGETEPVPVVEEPAATAVKKKRKKEKSEESTKKKKKKQ
ncbi:predicted protein [Naegleria gruberi]|uniref:Predicted protein n=1 Tax=Naegleria gruberi TaxID=5762 RepID=D2VM09_NAEGR|nr:uncharacterized protein NAEGRDRAFT_69970 [Naegleria gruberi]EFC42237.1 predicted protein [Naegleria gruberi]|eukprot:XP_002674981.1 predicted protein [Naegleria gruberi strain NEG-M]